MIYCRTLGPVDVVVHDTAAPPELLWRKNLALLVYLARSPKRARTRDHLVGLLWGEKPESAARHSLNEAVRVLRKYADEGGLESEGDQIRLSEGAVQLDVDRFEARLAKEDWAGAAELVTGEFLEGFFVPDCSEFDSWLTTERLAWRQRSVDVLVQRAEQLLSGGDAREAIASAQRALALDAASNMAARVAIRGVALSGDRAGALVLYDAFSARLDEEIGIEPDEETQALAERVRREREWKLAEPARVDESGAGGGAESRRGPLVGREAELSQLLGAWNDCLAEGRATLALIDGHPGTGKTRLSEELVGRARLDGAVVASLRAVEADLDEAWSGLLGLAGGALLDAPGLSAAPPAALAAFAAHLPTWADRFGSRIEGLDPVQPGRALTEVLRAVGAEGPVMLLVDDAQWLDRDSLLALGAILRDLAEDVPPSLYVLMTTAPYPGRAELDELRAHIGRDLHGATIQLSPLPTTALLELARWALPTYGDVELDRITRRVSIDSAGLPLLAVELLHAVALGLDLRSTPGAWPEPLQTLEQTLPSDLPDAVTAAIRVGFRRLSGDAQGVLAAAAVLGDRVKLAGLRHALALNEEALARALDELEWTRWLYAEMRGYSFVARIVRQVVAADMVTEGQRQRILEAAGS